MKKIPQLILIISFFTILFLPIVDGIFDLDNTSNLERRQLAELPIWAKETISDYPSKMNTFIADNFGFRNWLVTTSAMLKYKFFRSGNKNVIFGDDNWMFLNHSAGEGDLIFRDYTHRNLLSSQELEDFNSLLKKRIIDLKKMGIKYYKGFYPNKHTIYADKLPLRSQACIIGEESKADQVHNYLVDSGTINFIDVREDLLAEKKNHSLYYKGDTHWNEYGAYIAYNKTMKFISKDFPDLKPKELTHFDIKWYKSMDEWKSVKEELCSNKCYDEYIVGRDNVLYTPRGLLGLLGFQKTELLDSIPIFIPKRFSRFTKVDESRLSYDRTSETFINLDNPNGRTALIFRDSYSLNLLKFFYPHFGKLIVHKGPFRMHLVEEAQPDLVIDSKVERHLMN